MPTIVRNQVPEPPEHLVGFELGQLVDRDDQRRIAENAPLPVDDGGQLPERLEAVAGARLGHAASVDLKAGLSFFRFLGAERRVNSAMGPRRRGGHTRPRGSAGWRTPHRLAVARHRRQLALRHSLLGEPVLPLATTKLAASRLTSHSNGPGRVSSKSLRSKTKRRSGEANTPKLHRCASPQSWIRAPTSGSLPGQRPSAAPRPGRT